MAEKEVDDMIIMDLDLSGINGVVAAKMMGTIPQKYKTGNEKRS